MQIVTPLFDLTMTPGDIAQFITSMTTFAGVVYTALNSRRNGQKLDLNTQVTVEGVKKVEKVVSKVDEIRVSTNGLIETGKAAAHAEGVASGRAQEKAENGRG